MKIPLALAAVLLFSPAVGSVASEPLTAEELARHLHVFFWVTSVDLEGRQFDVEVVHVVDGKVKSTLLANTATPTDRRLERLVILANPTPQGTKISIQPGSSGAMAMSLTEPSDIVPLLHTMGLPEKTFRGDYLLGEGATELDPRSGEKPIHIEDVKEGLVLRLHPKNDG